MLSCSVLIQYLLIAIIEIHMQLSEGCYYAKHIQVHEQRYQWCFCCSVCLPPDVWGRRDGRPQKGEQWVHYFLQYVGVTSPGRYCNSHYTLASVLEQHKDQHFINHIAHFSKWFPHLFPLWRALLVVFLWCISTTTRTTASTDIHLTLLLVLDAHTGTVLRPPG